MVKMTNEVEWARLIFGIGWRSGYGFNLMQASSHGGVYRHRKCGSISLYKCRGFYYCPREITGGAICEAKC